MVCVLQRSDGSRGSSAELGLVVKVSLNVCIMWWTGEIVGHGTVRYWVMLVVVVIGAKSEKKLKWACQVSAVRLLNPRLFHLFETLTRPSGKKRSNEEADDAKRIHI